MGDDDDQVRAEVSALLRAAGVDPPPAEVDRLAGVDGDVRRSLDRFRAVDVGDEVTAAVFRADPADTDGEGARS